MSTMPQQKTSVFPSLASQGEIDGEMMSSKDSSASKYEEARVSSLPLGPAVLLAIVFLGYFLTG
jgi:hypothetical protein